MPIMNLDFIMITLYMYTGVANEDLNPIGMMLYSLFYVYTVLCTWGVARIFLRGCSFVCMPLVRITYVQGSVGGGAEHEGSARISLLGGKQICTTYTLISLGLACLPHSLMQSTMYRMALS